MRKSTLVVLLILFSIIVYRFLNWPSDDTFLNNFKGRLVTISAQVIEDPDVIGDVQRIIVQVKKADDQDIQNSSAEHLIQVSVKNFKPILYGDQIVIKGKILNISDSNGSGNSSYSEYMRVRNIFYQIKNSKVSIVGNNPPSQFKNLLIHIKNNFVQRIDSLLPQPQSFLGAGLVLTGKGSLDQDLQNEFKRVGLIHIVVLSGFNVSIVAIVIMALLNFLPPVVRFVFGIFCMTCFCLMVGGGASVMRSLVMNTISIFGRTMNLPYSPLQGLCVAGIIMLVFNPMLLFFDPSFQMSFMATLGLILLSNKISKYVSFLPEKFGVKETVSATLSTQIAVTPLIMHFSGIVSIISLFTNIVVLPFIPFTMLFVATSVFLSFASNFLALISAYISYVLLTYELWVVHVCAGWSFSAIEFPAWSWKQTLFCYFVIVFIYLSFHFKLFTKNGKKEIRMFFKRHDAGG
ncbi:MAG: ComEC/Rec2 family competence protein [bacterium]